MNFLLLDFLDVSFLCSMDLCYQLITFKDKINVSIYSSKNIIITSLQRIPPKPYTSLHTCFVRRIVLINVCVGGRTARPSATATIHLSANLINCSISLYKVQTRTAPRPAPRARRAVALHLTNNHIFHLHADYTNWLTYCSVYDVKNIHWRQNIVGNTFTILELIYIYKIILKNRNGCHLCLLSLFSLDNFANLTLFVSSNIRDLNNFLRVLYRP